MSYVVGVDIGGTFTDCIVVADDGRSALSTAPTMPPAFVDGFLASIAGAAERLGLCLEQLLAQTSGVHHASTVGLNALIEGKAPKSGLTTTRGHADSLVTMGADKCRARMLLDRMPCVAAQLKRELLIPRELILDIDERIAAGGDVLVPLNEGSVIAAVDRLLGADVDAIAVSLLWSGRKPLMSDESPTLVAERGAGAFVSLSSRVSPRIGEFERTVAICLSAMLGPLLPSTCTGPRAPARQRISWRCAADDPGQGACRACRTASSISRRSRRCD